MPTLELPDSTYNNLLELSDATGMDAADLLSVLLERGLDGPSLLFQNGTTVPPPSATSQLLAAAVEKITMPTAAVPLEVFDLLDSAPAKDDIVLNWNAISSSVPNDSLVLRCATLSLDHREALASVYSVLDDADWGGSFATKLWLRQCLLAGLPAPTETPTSKTD